MSIGVPGDAAVLTSTEVDGVSDVDGSPAASSISVVSKAGSAAELSVRVLSRLTVLNGTHICLYSPVRNDIYYKIEYHSADHEFISMQAQC